MFGLAWSEIGLIGVVAMILIGPKDMPVAIKAVSDMVKKARRMAGEFQGHVDEMLRDSNLSEVRQSISELRGMDLRGHFERAVDADGSLRTAFTEDPFTVTPTAATTGHVEQTILAPEATAPAEGSVSFAPVEGSAKAQGPARGPVPMAAPAFVPPEYVPPEPLSVPAFIPPEAARASLTAPTVAKPPVEDVIDDKPMPLLEHLVELRRRLLWSAVAFLLAFFVSYHFSGRIYSFLAEPLARVLVKHGGTRGMIFTSLTEGFFTNLRLAVFGAAFVSFPIVATQLWLFVAPGLYRSEKRALLPFLAATPILFVAGAALAYYFVFPIAFTFFVSFATPNGAAGLPITVLPKVADYLDLVMKLVFAFGVAFELPVALSLLAKVGIVTSKGLKKMRRYAWVGMFVIAAVLAPPDVITQTGLAVPLIALYEISIIAARMVEPKPVDA